MSGAAPVKRYFVGLHVFHFMVKGNFWRFLSGYPETVRPQDADLVWYIYLFEDLFYAKKLHGR